VIIVLKEDVTIEEGAGVRALGLTIKGGSSLSAIRFDYILADAHVCGGEAYSRKELERKFYVVYVRGHLWAIPKKACLVPKYFHGKYNV
jgi:hypothetical protein